MASDGFSVHDISVSVEILNICIFGEDIMVRLEFKLHALALVTEVEGDVEVR
jgi:hypothetical protein